MRKWMMLIILLAIAGMVLAGCGDEPVKDDKDDHGDHDHGDAGHGHGDDHGGGTAMPELKAGQGFDPVCTMTPKMDAAAGKSNFNGMDYYFCMDKHKKEFDNDPMKFAYCPVTKDKLTAGEIVKKTIDGKEYSFCCEMCVDKFSP